MMPTTHPLAADFLSRLDAAASTLPGPDREELVAQIRDHIDAALTPDATEADVRNLLDDLGTPEQIVAAARQEYALTSMGAVDHLPPRRRVAVFEIVALVVLVLGSLALPLLLGWLPGAVMVLMSRMWSWRDKVIGLALLLVPLAVTLVLAQAGVELGPIDLLGVVLAVGYLGWRLRRRSSF
jgi:uncharacterized membrane protein